MYGRMWLTSVITKTKVNKKRNQRLQPEFAYSIEDECLKDAQRIGFVEVLVREGHKQSIACRSCVINHFYCHWYSYPQSCAKVTSLEKLTTAIQDNKNISKSDNFLLRFLTTKVGSSGLRLTNLTPHCMPSDTM